MSQAHQAILPSTFSASNPAGRAQGSLWLACLTLWKREMVRFLRQRSRVMGAFAQPILFWIVIGSGVGKSMLLHSTTAATTASDAVTTTSSSMNFMVFFYPGMIVMMLLFTAIFSTITVIEDRREGFLQGVLVAPVPRLAIVLGKVFGGATIGLVQGIMLLAAWPLIQGSWPGILPMVYAVLVMALLAVALTSLGLLVAWPLDSTAGFHGIMMTFLMPMWFLSGSMFPMTGASFWIRALMWCNPLMYGYSAFSALITNQPGGLGTDVPLMPSLIVTVIFTAVMLGLAVVMVRRPHAGGV